MEHSDLVNALASTLPANIDYDPGHAIMKRWKTEDIAQYQAMKLHECGYVLVHPDLIERNTNADVDPS